MARIDEGEYRLLAGAGKAILTQIPKLGGGHTRETLRLAHAYAALVGENPTGLGATPELAGAWYGE